MGIIEEIVDKAKMASDYAGKKANELYEITKANIAVIDIQNEIGRRYKQIGQLFYSMTKEGKSEDEAIKEKLAELDTLFVRLNEQQETLQQLKKNKKCPSCGKVNAKDSQYCTACGGKLE